MFLISDIRALWRSVLSARAPECQKLKDQYGAEPFEQQQFGPAGVEDRFSAFSFFIIVHVAVNVLVAYTIGNVYLLGRL